MLIEHLHCACRLNSAADYILLCRERDTMRSQVQVLQADKNKVFVNALLELAGSDVISMLALSCSARQWLIHAVHVRYWRNG